VVVDVFERTVLVIIVFSCYGLSAFVLNAGCFNETGCFNEVSSFDELGFFGEVGFFDEACWIL